MSIYRPVSPDFSSVFTSLRYYVTAINKIPTETHETTVTIQYLCKLFPVLPTFIAFHRDRVCVCCPEAADSVVEFLLFSAAVLGLRGDRMVFCK